MSMYSMVYTGIGCGGMCDACVGLMPIVCEVCCVGEGRCVGVYSGWCVWGGYMWYVCVCSMCVT